MEFLIASWQWGCQKKIWSVEGGSGSPWLCSTDRVVWPISKCFGKKLHKDPCALLKNFWVLSDAVQKNCGGFSEKVRKLFSFFLPRFWPMAKCADIFSQDDVTCSYHCYDTTLVAIGNGVWKWRVFPFFDFEAHSNMLSWWKISMLGSNIID